MRLSEAFGVTCLLSGICPIAAQVAPLASCAVAIQPAVVRAEGLAERAGDVVLDCNGGIPTPSGARVQSATVEIRFLNANTANVGRAGSSLTDAMLILGDPLPVNQVLHTLETPAGLLGVGGTGIDFANPPSAVNFFQQVRNVYRGRLAGSNTVRFADIPFDPGPAGRTVRLTNLRVDASLLAESGARQVLIQVSSPQLAIPDSTYSIATVQQGLQHAAPNVAVYTAVAGATAVAQGSGSAGPPSGVQPPSFRLRFAEGFPAAFKSRVTTEGQDQAILGPVHFSESGFYNERFAGGLGLASFGTRLAASFSGVPAGARLFVRAGPGAGTSPGIEAVAIEPGGNCSGEFAPAAAVNGFHEVTIREGAGLFCAEIVRQNPSLLEAAVFDAFLSTGAAAAGMVTAELFLAPLSAYPVGRSASGLTAPVFRAPVDPMVRTRAAHVAARIYAPSDVGISRIQVTRPAEFEEGVLRGGSATVPLTVNVIVNNAGAPRDTVVTPIAGPFQPLLRAATVGWFTVLPSQNATPLTLAIQANTSGLAPGTYEAGVRVETTGTNPTANDIPVRLVIPPPGPQVAANAVLGAAEYSAGAVAPGQAIVVFGAGFGPERPVELTLDGSGRLATMLGETRVLFDGVAAPMIYARTGQVSVFVPFGVASREVTEMRIEFRGAVSAPVYLRVAAASPGLFTANASGFGQGAILNEDGTVNSAANPADPGDIIVLFGSGAGQTNPRGTDGRLAASPLPALTQPARVLVDGVEADVLYAASAPGLAEGVVQVNARLPSNARRGGNAEVVLLIGEFRSQPGVTVAMRP